MSDELLSGALPSGDVGSASIEPVAAPVEKSIPQSQFDKAAGAIRAQGREYAEQRAREAVEEYKKTQQQQYSQPVQQQSNLGGMSPGMTPEQVRQIVAEQAETQRWQGVLQHAENTFAAKIQAHKAQMPDIDEKLRSFGIEKFPELVILANSVENTGAVIEDLLKNPIKAAQLVQAARTPGMDHLAIQAMNELSNSIKMNLAGHAAPRANAPLSQLTPSNTGTSDGAMSQSELRSLDYLQA